MKIIVVASLTRSLINFRGALLRDIVQSGDHEVIAAAPEADAQAVCALERIGVGFRRIPMARASTNPLADARTLFSLVALFRNERPDIVLAYTQKPIIYGGLAARFAPGARFFAMQSGLGYAFSEENRNGLLRRFVTLLYRLGVAKAEAVFVFNGDDEADMRGFGILRRGQTVVQVPGSGVDLSRFQAQPLPGGAPTFLLVSRLMRDKGVFEYAEAARVLRAEFPSAKFQVLGPLDANPTSISAVQLKALQDEGAVEYLGETADVRPFLAACSVFVLPSYHREGLPRSILEAMATGRPIVTTSTPGCRETVVEGENGFLTPPRDAAALAAAMRRFLEEPELIARMGAKSRALAEEKFAVELVNDRLLRTMGLRGASPEASAALSVPIGRRDGLRRLADIAGAVVGLSLLLPVGLVVAAAIYATMGRPIFFTQERAGRGGRPFVLVKFRTMTNATGSNGGLLPDEKRITVLGKVLRRLRIDELPELWNILKGDMSFIGPRPLLPTSPPNLGAGGRLRLSVRPGLTGWAQVNGNTLLDDDMKLSLDLWYVENRSWLLDLKILVKTAGVALFGERINNARLARANESSRRRSG